MNAADLFAQLSSKASDYEFMPFGTEDNKVNLAMYTKGMRYYAYLAARFVWSKDLSVHAEMRSILMESTFKIAKFEKWELKRCNDRIATIVALALTEHYAPNIFRTHKARYLYCGISESQWFRLWAKRYEVPYRTISSYLDVANRSVHN